MKGYMVLLVPPATDQVLAERDLMIRRTGADSGVARTCNDPRRMRLKLRLPSREEVSSLHNQDILWTNL